MEPQEVDAIIRHLAASIAKQDAINEDLRACVREQREFNARQLEMNQHQEGMSMSESIVANGKVPRQSSPPHSPHTAGRLAAIYARVSSEEQRENQTIKTQTEAAKRWVEFQKLRVR